MGPALAFGVFLSPGQDSAPLQNRAPHFLRALPAAEIESDATPRKNLNFRRHIIAPALLALGLSLCLSCRTAQLPPADFSSPGWQMRQGQAVWRPTKGRPELAGDLLLAVNTNGDYFVQFSKTPFTLATAQMAAGAWRIEFGDGKHSWSGRGPPPRRFAWFQLPRALADGIVAPPWKLTREPDQSWRLENPRTGETLEGYLP
jgi:hypothetical protein